jgi:hypothetical protein
MQVACLLATLPLNVSATNPCFTLPESTGKDSSPPELTEAGLIATPRSANILSLAYCLCPREFIKREFWHCFSFLIQSVVQRYSTCLIMPVSRKPHTRCSHRIGSQSGKPTPVKVSDSVPSACVFFEPAVHQTPQIIHLSCQQCCPSIWRHAWHQMEGRYSLVFPNSFRCTPI